MLQKSGVKFEIAEHKAVYNMADVAAAGLSHPGAEAKNLFLRDDKRQNYYILVIKDGKKADIKQFRKRYGARPLTFAGEEELKEILGLFPGAVTPFGALNDKSGRTRVYIDGEFKENLIGVHPADNTATIYLKTEDLAETLRAGGAQVFFAEF